MNPEEHPVTSSLKMQQYSPHQESSLFLDNQKFRDSSIAIDILKSITGKTSPQIMHFLRTNIRLN